MDHWTNPDGSRKRRDTRDTVTGLPDRGPWDAAVATACSASSDGPPSVILVFELDKRRSADDVDGQVADTLTRAFAGALRAAARAGDVVVRFDEDQFGVVLVAGGPSAKKAYLERLRWFLADADRRIVFAVGAALVAAADDPRACVRRADAALGAELAARPRRPGSIAHAS